MFLMAEAELLDSNDLDAWLTMLAPEVSYAMPVRTARLNEDPGPGATDACHFSEDRASLELRVRRRLESNAVWSENPAPRTRRFVSNVRVRRTGPAELTASSYLLLLRSRHDLENYDLISAERTDRLARNDSGALVLCEREIVVDQARLGVANLPIPL
jgi:3-phenylpropionate/cinnamic acid dioxygenase small subunit